MRKLLKTYVINNGAKAWTLKNEYGERIFYGDTEDFIRLLKRLKVSDNLTDPRSKRNLTYMDIVQGILNHTNPYIYIWSNRYPKKTILNT